MRDWLVRTEPRLTGTSRTKGVRQALDDQAVTWAPASTTIMITVPARQAVAGSAINDTIREVGGALGIAIIGSLAAAVYRSWLAHVLTAQHAPGPLVHAATCSVAAADAADQQAGSAPGSELVAAAHGAFVNAMAIGVRVAAAVAWRRIRDSNS